MPIPKATEVNLSAEEQEGLEQLVRRHNVVSKLHCAVALFYWQEKGKPAAHSSAIWDQHQHGATLAQSLGKAQTISYEDLSIEDRLQDGPRPGVPSRITADQRLQD